MSESPHTMARSNLRRRSRSPAPRKRGSVSKGNARKPKAQLEPKSKPVTLAPKPKAGKGALGKMAGRISSGTAEAEAATFYFYARIVFAALALVMYHAPAAPPGGKCDNVGLMWLVKGAGPSRLISTLEEAWGCAVAYRGAHPSFTLAIVCALYIGLQTFAIPGPIVLSVLAGALYGFWGGQLLIAICAGTGASLCFMLSRTMGRGVLHAYKLDGMIDGYAKQVAEHRDNLFSYMLLTRVTPVPNVLVNVASALVGVPLWIFALSTPIGQFPLNALHTTTGAALASGDVKAMYEKNQKFGIYILGGGSLLCLLVYLRHRASTAKKV